MLVWTHDFKGDRELAYKRLETARLRYFQHLDLTGDGQPDLSMPPKPGYQLTIRGWRDKYRGQRCFIIGNGPSLQKMDLSHLKHEITIGTNGLYRHFREWGWHTNYLLFEDTEQTELRGPEIFNVKGPVKMAAIYNAYAFDADKDTVFFNARRADAYYWSELHPQFSRQFDQIVFLGSTVTYIALQLAFHLGFQDVYLIGVDHNYGKLTELFPPGKIRVTEDNYHLVRQCHYDPDYYKIGDQIGVPQVKLQNEAFAKAARVFRDHGRNVVNAGLDSRLDAFKRGNYAHLFNNTSRKSKRADDSCTAPAHSWESRRSIAPYRDTVVDLLRSLHVNGTPYAVYGAGKIGRGIADLAVQNKLTLPACFIDDTPETSEMAEASVIRPEQLESHQVEKIVLGTDTFQEQMRKRLVQMGWQEQDTLEIVAPPPTEPVVLAARSKPRVLFLSHASNLSGAPLSLRSLIKFFRGHRDWDARIIIRRRNGPIDAFNELAPCDFAELAGEPAPQRHTHIARLRSQLADWTPDFIYSNTALNGDLIHELGLDGVPTVVHVRELDQTFRTLSPLQLERFRNQPRHYFAVSHAVRDYLMSYQHIPGERIHVVPVGLECGKVIEAARERDSSGYHRRHKNLICGIGTPGYRKGTDLFIRCAAMVCKQRPDTCFAWIGGGSDLLTYQQLADTENLSDQIRFTGELRNPYPLIGLADLLLMTSRDDPFPRVNLEAALLGVPSICFGESGGSKEFVAEQCGKSLDRIDPCLLADATADLLNSPNLLRQYAVNARTKVLDHYDVTTVGATALALMDRFIERKAA